MFSSRSFLSLDLRLKNHPTAASTTNHGAKDRHQRKFIDGFTGSPEGLKTVSVLGNFPCTNFR